MKRKPVVGITGPDRGGIAAWLFTKLAVWRAGGKARRITPSRPHSIYGLDALVIGGGADIAPDLYGEDRETFWAEIKKKHRTFTWYAARLLFFPALLLIRKLFSTKAASQPDPERDKLETELLGEALDKRLPILGICRGAQLINVVLGGSLYQNIEEFYVETPQVHSVLPKKRVLIEPDSKLAVMLQARQCSVNALHRQAIKKPGRDLAVVATETNGVIQAVEHRNLPYVLGVQWHPEYLPQQKEQLAMFVALVLAAKSRCT